MHLTGNRIAQNMQSLGMAPNAEASEKSPLHIHIPYNAMWGSVMRDAAKLWGQRIDANTEYIAPSLDEKQPCFRLS